MRRSDRWRGHFLGTITEDGIGYDDGDNADDNICLADIFDNGVFAGGAVGGSSRIIFDVAAELVPKPGR